MGKIIKISGPLIVADGMQDVKMYDVVRVSDKGLIGEVIELRGVARPYRYMKKRACSARASP